MTFCLRTFPTGQVFTGVSAPEGEKACEDMGAAGSCDGCGCVAGPAAFGSSLWGAEVMSQGCRVRSWRSLQKSSLLGKCLSHEKWREPQPGICVQEGRLNLSGKLAIRSDLAGWSQGSMGWLSVLVQSRRLKGSRRGWEGLKGEGLGGGSPFAVDLPKSWSSYLSEEDSASQRALLHPLLSKHYRKCKLLFQKVFASKNGSLLQIFS